MYMYIIISTPQPPTDMEEIITSEEENDSTEAPQKINNK